MTGEASVMLKLNDSFALDLVRDLYGDEQELMAWARIDDGFDDHPKLLGLLEDEGGITAVGLWTLCLTWAHRNTRKKGKTPGLIPAGLPRRYLGPGGRETAKLLVAHGLWDEVEDGWQIHDFADYLPSDETREARAEAGRKGAAKRWGSKKADSGAKTEPGSKQTDGNLPSGSHEDAGNGEANDGSRARRRAGTISKEIAPEPEPTPEPGDEPSVHHETSPAEPDDESEQIRDDIERVCKHLADRIEGNGSKRPRITRTWQDSARLLMDADKRTEAQVHTAIDWCQDDEFWRSKVMSLPKLREKYDQLRLEAQRQGGRNSPPGTSGAPRSTTDERVAQVQALKAKYRTGTPPANEQQQTPPNTIPGAVVA